jgi:protein SCO1
MKSLKLKYRVINTIFNSFLIAMIFCSCEQKTEKKLPILGERQLSAQNDTIYHKIADFEFTSQENQKITNETFKGKIYITDFFFTTCPSICPRMKSQMLRVYEKYKTNPKVVLLSHSIDTRHDSVPVLKAYAKKLGIENAEKWLFVTGIQEKIFKMAENYFITAQVDADAPGGYIHNGFFVLVDDKRLVRGAYDGTDPIAVDRLLLDIEVLLAELNQQKNGKL